MRDAILELPIVDIDIATPARPEEVIAALEAARLKAVPTGIAHGTVTAVVPPRHFEITTLRRDVETFGRHARVAFTDDWAADAARRDFTMNALFLEADGNLYDLVGGLADLRAGRVRFVGDAATRIREDVLRLLRFYRFHAHYGRSAPDAAARDACRSLAHLLPTISGERVAAETLKLLNAPDPLPTLRLMAEDGVLAILFPEATRLDRLQALLPLEPVGDPLRRLAALLPDRADAAERVARRLRLSNAQRHRLLLLAAPPSPVDVTASPQMQRRALRRLGLDGYRDLVLLRAAESGGGPGIDELLREAPGRLPPPFPLRGRDAEALGVPAGPRIGRLLAAVEHWWEEGDFRADRASCLARLEALARSEDAAP
ncbi:MAG: CCA tRNA nucleotidyltransferase [Alphaproteobacteria bacterium]|nr:CCA tRNA nucleotidyltransferase [Alphaproteobacteria bacterium]